MRDVADPAAAHAYLGRVVTDLIGMPVATMTSGYARYIRASNEHRLLL
jgi:hypothetical protein